MDSTEPAREKTSDKKSLTGLLQNLNAHCYKMIILSENVRQHLQFSSRYLAKQNHNRKQMKNKYA